MQSTGLVSLLIIIVTFIFSYQGFNNRLFFDKYAFRVDKILINKEYKRLLTSGFLHVGWLHLIFNLISLYAFSGALEMHLGAGQYLLIYFVSLVGANLLSLLIHKNDSDYSSVGASGAVSGVIFATIALFPDMDIGFFFLPIGIPGWLYGVVYTLYSIYGIRSKRDNIGHDAHLGGALIGLLMAILLHPEVLVENYLTLLLIGVPALVFMYFIIKRPQFLLVDNLFYKNHPHNFSIDQKYNFERQLRQKEIDRILEKIHRKGIHTLTPKEKRDLEVYSKSRS